MDIILKNLVFIGRIGGTLENVKLEDEDGSQAHAGEGSV